jgi:phospholipase C
VTAQTLSALVGNPALWERTVMFETYDENGGFFDHVAPPTAPRGTAGEWLTVSPLPPAAAGIAGPIGLGMRVPGLVISPFSRGGLVCSDTFDHTSLLRFLETRFGVEVPNLSAWRRAAVGDLTSALNLAVKRDTSVPSLPQPSPVDPTMLRECAPSAVQGQIQGNLFTVPVVGQSPPYPVPAHQQLPRQEPGPPRRHPRR